MEQIKDITAYIDFNISGKHCTLGNLTLAPFVAGFLQKIITSTCFKSAARPLQEQIKHLSFLVHLACRFDDVGTVIENHNIVKSDIEKGLADWEDDHYFRSWEQRILTEIYFTNNDFSKTNDLEPKIEIDKNSNYDNDNDGNFESDEDYMPENDIKINVAAKKRLKKYLRSKVEDGKINILVENEDQTIQTVSSRERRSFSCNSCDFTSKHQKRYDKHMFEKHEQTLCSICGVKFDTFDFFICHVEAHMPEKCEVCHKSFKNKDILKKHVDNTHNKTAKEMCPICGKIYKNVGNHVRLVHEYMSKKCPHCPYSSKISTDLNRHIKRTHTEETVTTCPYCAKRTKNIKRHLRKNKCDRPEERVVEQIKCDKCDKTFSSKEHHKRHIKRIHDKILDIHCLQCDYKTYSNFNLRIHVTRVHEGKQLKQTCPYCQATVISLDWHIKMYHVEKVKGKFEDDTNQRPNMLTV